VGSSFVALKAAASLCDRGHKVSVVAPEKQPMARIFGSQLAELIAAAHWDHGVDWHVGRKVEQVTADDHEIRIERECRRRASDHEGQEMEAGDEYHQRQSHKRPWI
jgi:NADPH-dependent 2,4-dienoyl-CoA reductase/sulfur reductase-like enzyme